MASGEESGAGVGVGVGVEEVDGEREGDGLELGVRFAETGSVESPKWPRAETPAGIKVQAA